MGKKNFIVFSICVAAIAIIWMVWPEFVAAPEATKKSETVVTVSENRILPEPEAKPEDKDREVFSESLPKSVIIENVPFTVQAPFAEWSDKRFQNGCEEASLVMAAHWISGEPITREEAKQEILDLVKYQEEKTGNSVDSSALDTEKLFRDFYQLGSSQYHSDVNVEDIEKALSGGALVIVPADGRKLGNPNFTPPGPERHMLVIIGYDQDKEFITNDPGTRTGKGYRYKQSVLYDAIMDYPTGDHLPVTSKKKPMIVVMKNG